MATSRGGIGECSLRIRCRVAETRPVDPPMEEPIDLANADGNTRSAVLVSRRPDIQGLRALAVLLVVTFHAGLPVQGGFIGVDVFFVISGFVISSLLTRDLVATQRVRFRAFYARRIRRILPALALLTTVVALMSMALQSALGTQQVTGRMGLGATFLVANAVAYREPSGYFDFGATTDPLLHTWTLSVEEQFYLVFPAVLAFGWFLGRRLLRGSRRGAIVAVFGVLVISFGLSLVLSTGILEIAGLTSPEKLAFYSSPTRAWEFATGALLALTTRHLNRIPKQVALWMGVAGTAAILIGAFRIDDLHYPGLAALIPVLGTSAVIAAGSSSGAGVSKLLSTKPMVWIGDLSYSWYLWHWPLLVFATLLWQFHPSLLVPVAALSLIPAWLSFRFVEQPIRWSSVFRGRRVLALAGVCIAVPALACAVLLGGARIHWGSASLAQMAAQLEPKHADTISGCDTGTDLGSLPTGTCVWNPIGEGVPIYLLGDSNAGQFSESLIGASTALGSQLTIQTLNGCAFVSGTSYWVGRPYPRCTEYVSASVAWLRSRPPGIVVIAANTDGYIHTGDAYLAGPGSEFLATTEEDKAAVWAPSLTPVLQELRGAGHQVLLVHPVPHFWNPGYQTWFPVECPNVIAAADAATCGRRVTLDSVIVDQASAYQAEAEAAAATGSATLDLRPELCASDSCSTNNGDQWAYRDGNHITVDESAALAPIFTKALSPLAARVPLRRAHP